MANLYVHHLSVQQLQTHHRATHLISLQIATPGARASLLKYILFMHFKATYNDYYYYFVIEFYHSSK